MLRYEFKGLPNEGIVSPRMANAPAFRAINEAIWRWTSLVGNSLIRSRSGRIVSGRGRAAINVFRLRLFATSSSGPQRGYY